jgi:hypothetical protein
MVKLITLLKYCLCAFLFLTMTGCPDEIPEDDTGVYIENKTGSKLVFFAPHSEPNEVIDTALTSEFPWGNIDDINEKNILQPNSIGFDPYYSGHLKTILEQGWIHYFIFNYDSITTISWERIRDEYIVAKRIDFDTWEDLEASDFKITYP